MALKVEVLQVPAQPTLSTRLRVPSRELGEKLSELLPAVFAYALNRGLGPGRPFVRYHGEENDVLDVEAGVPVDAPGDGEDDIRPGALPACEVAVLLHEGAHQLLRSAHADLAQWATENGKTSASGAWEVYITDPADDPDPASWKTKIYLPLRGNPG